jgi:hypothetical protein
LISILQVFPQILATCTHISHIQLFLHHLAGPTLAVCQVLPWANLPNTAQNFWCVSVRKTAAADIGFSSNGGFALNHHWLHNSSKFMTFAHHCQQLWLPSKVFL